MAGQAPVRDAGRTAARHAALAKRYGEARAREITECLRCGKPLYGRVTYTRPDGTTYKGYSLRRADALYCSNACRQAAYRERVRARKAAERALGDPHPRRPPKSLEP